MYQIHEVCERCHLSRKAIRLYEEKGLLHPDRIQGNRMYNKEDVVRLQCISYYRGLGFSLEQIQQLLHGSSEKCSRENPGKAGTAEGCKQCYTCDPAA